MNGAPEFWLRGPVPGIDRTLMPVAHALLQARADLEALSSELSDDWLWQRPGTAASAGFHLQHLAGSLDRLFTYARGEALSDSQLATLRQEGVPGRSSSELVSVAIAAIDRALEQLRETPVDALFESRAVGRAKLPATVIGLLFHGAEHTTRHVGQLITTMKAVRSSPAV